MTSLAREYYQVILAQGVCIGLGGGMLYVPSIAAVSASFEEAKRPLIVGIIGSGAGIGDPIPLSTSFILVAKLTRWCYLSYRFPPAAATDRLWMDCPHHGLSLAFWLPIYLHHPSIQT